MREPLWSNLSRRRFVGLAASAAGVAAALPGSAQEPSAHGARVVVATDGSGDFGPQTPGTATSGIQEALEAVHAAGGGAVLLRRGVYLVDHTSPPSPDARRFGCGLQSIGLYGDVTLRGEGLDQTIIRTAAECNTNALLGWQTSRVCLEDLTVDGARLNAGYGIAIFGMGTSFSDVYLRRVKVTGFGGSAIGIAGGRRVTIEQCCGLNSAIGLELGSPSVDYQVLHCTACGCTNGTLIFDPADQYNEAGNARPRVVGGVYDGEGRASGVALWDCWEPALIGVTAVRGVTTNLQISSSHRPTITTPVGGGLMEACLAEASVGSAAGRYGIGACQDGVRVLGCSVVGNEDLGVLAAPDPGGRIGVFGCAFGAGEGDRQRYAIVPQGEGVALHAGSNLWDGRGDGFLGNPAALAASASRLTGNAGFNPVGLLTPPEMPTSGDFAPNPHPFPVEVHVHSGRVRTMRKRDARGREALVAAHASNVRLEPGEAVAISYSRPPAWTWFGL